VRSSAPGDIARRIGGNLARGVRRVVDWTTLPRRDGFWLDVRLSGPLDELVSPAPPFGRGPTGSLLELLELLAAAASDPQVHGVLLRISRPAWGMSRLLSLRRAILGLRESGTPVVVYADSLETESLLVASAASRIWLPESGNVLLLGLRLESLFLRGVLDRVDVKPEIVSIGRYKSAGEVFTRESMSPEDREQREALADDLYHELVAGIAAGRGLAAARVRELVDGGPYHARDAVAAGLADRCLYPDEIDAALEELTPVPPADRPGPRRVRRVDSALYFAIRVGDPGWRPLLRGVPRVAYVVARGTIARGGGHRGIASDGYGDLLDSLRRDPGVYGVVLRIDSGGGDAIASDLLWRAVSVVTREKPVVVSMGDVVASGGYYMASAADWVVAETGSVTGSIGVVGGKVNLAGLYERVGVAKHAVERGARAGLLSEDRGFTPDEKHALRGEMAALYETFVARVAQGRGLSAEAVGEVAEGRLWSGARASQIGLVDAIGGPLEALLAVRRRAGLRVDEPLLVERYPRRPRLPSLRNLLRVFPLR
jgi:protease-4